MFLLFYSSYITSDDFIALIVCITFLHLLKQKDCWEGPSFLYLLNNPKLFKIFSFSISIYTKAYWRLTHSLPNARLRIFVSQKLFHYVQRHLLLQSINNKFGCFFSDKFHQKFNISPLLLCIYGRFCPCWHIIVENLCIIYIFTEENAS